MNELAEGSTQPLMWAVSLPRVFLPLCLLGAFWGPLCCLSVPCSRRYRSHTVHLALAYLSRRYTLKPTVV